MKICLIGCGCGPETLTREAAAAIEGSGLLIGSARLLREYGGGKVCVEAVTADAVAAAVQSASENSICILCSGDIGFYSGAKNILSCIKDEEIRVIPGISSVQLFAARLQRPWQDWQLCSAHGQECDAVGAVCSGQPVFFLTGGKNSPDALCRALEEAGLGSLRVAAGEDLGSKRERISFGTAAEFARRTFSPLSVLLAEPAPGRTRHTAGLPDSAFLRAEKVPMTKREIRAAALARLSPAADEVCWDVGAGTGSVSVELALQARSVWAVEQDEAALRIAEENRRKHGAWNLRLVSGTAPEALEAFPRPDAVFVGGSGGRLAEILRLIHAKNPGARVCVTAVTLESLHTSVNIIKELGWVPEICQVSVSRAAEVGSASMLLAMNPVFLISNTKT